MKVYSVQGHVGILKPLNFARDLISLISLVMKIREIKYLQNFKFYINSNSKSFRFAKLSTCKNGKNFQFAKLSPRKNKVFYSILQWWLGKLWAATFEFHTPPVEDLRNISFRGSVVSK